MHVKNRGCYVMQNARFSHLVPFIALIVVQAASSAVPNGLAERAHVTIQTLERQEDIRTPAEAPSWLIMDTLLAFGQDYLLQSEQEDGLHITFSERLSGNNEQPEAKEYSPLFCCEGKVIVADRGSSAAWGERHPFQFLWCMAEAGLPLSMPIKVAGHPPVTISQVCTDAEKRITEFSTLSWALPTIAQCRGCGYKWTNRFDEGLTIKYLLKALLSPDHRSDEYCANSHKAFAVARVLSLCSGETDFDCVEMRTARQWLDSFWAKYKENVQSDGRIDYQAVGWPTWPEESTSSGSRGRRRRPHAGLDGVGL